MSIELGGFYTVIKTEDLVPSQLGKVVEVVKLNADSMKSKEKGKFLPLHKVRFDDKYTDFIFEHELEPVNYQFKQESILTIVS